MEYLSGVPLEAIQDQIRGSLGFYEETTANQVGFDLEGAVKLELTPDKPNTARSTTTVKYRGEETPVEMTVVVFNRDDATGSLDHFQFDKISSGEYLSAPKYMPRSKSAANIHTEAQLTISAHLLDAPQAEPLPFVGYYDLLGIVRNRLSLIGTLGQTDEEFGAVMSREESALPTTTLTTGYRGGLDTTKLHGERFGDPHAVHNSEPLVQVCGFIAVKEAMPAEYLGIFSALGAVEPTPVS